MTTNTDRVKELFAGFGGIDPEALADFFTDDATIQPVMKAPYEGRADIVRMFTLWAKGFTKVETPIVNLVGQGDVVFIEWLDKSEFDGKPHIVPCVGVFEFDGDKIKAWRLYYDASIEGSTEISGLNPPLARERVTSTRMPTTPQLSMYLPTFSPHDPGGWDHLLRRVRIAEEVGIDRVAVTDHVVFGESLEAYGNPAVGGTAGGRQPTGPDGHWLEPLMVLSHIAAITSRVRLGTSILIAALRRPVVLAKQLATLDVLSQGRVDVGVGVGWQREEYVAAGLDFDRRGALLDHTIQVCRTLWTETTAQFHDDLLEFTAIHQMPKPIQSGGPPVWVSGTFNRRSMDRLARFGSGWIPWGPAAADLPKFLPLVREALAERGRTDADALQVMGDVRIPRRADGRIDLSAATDYAAPLVTAGVTDLRIGIDVPHDESEQRDLLRSVVDSFHRSFR